MTSNVIDAYSHCGLRKYRPIEDVRAVADRFGVGRTVLVQHIGEYDNTYIEAIISAEPDRFAGVFLIDTDAPDASDILAGEAEKGVFRGIRLPACTLEERPHLWELAARLGLSIVVYSESTLAAHADALGDFLGGNGGTDVVLAHFGVLWPGVAPKVPDYHRVLSLAEHPNAYLQISGMHMSVEYPYGELVPFVDEALRAFGAERLLYGSNYPIQEDDAFYGREISLVLDGKLGVPEDAVEQVVCGTARRVWFDGGVE